MATKRFVFFLAAIIVIAFSWWFYSLFALSRSNYEANRKLLEFKYLEALKQYSHHAYKNEFSSDSGMQMTLSGKEVNIDTSKVRKYFNTFIPDIRIAFMLTGPQADSLITFPEKPNKIIALRKKFERKEQIWVAEGVTFFTILLLGIIVVIRSSNQSRETERQQRNFLLSITHEFKTPIASIKLYLQTIQKRMLTKEQVSKMIENSLKDIERLNVLSENVLVATKIESKGYQYEFDQINLSELIEAEVDALANAKQGEYFIQSSVEPEIFLEGDRFTLILVVSNLIENACKYSPAGSKVQVNLFRAGDGDIIFQVCDEGIGISEKDKEMVFNKFYRVGNENTRRTKGTGLGLYIVKEVSKKHNASVKILDNKPKGSIFEIRFES
jgi:two-component system phosphate regulon sensor histidine kinase PhoR